MEYLYDKDGNPRVNGQGEPQAPIWERIHCRAVSENINVEDAAIKTLNGQSGKQVKRGMKFAMHPKVMATPIATVATFVNQAGVDKPMELLGALGKAGFEPTSRGDTTTLGHLRDRDLQEQAAAEGVEVASLEMASDPNAAACSSGKKRKLEKQAAKHTGREETHVLRKIVLLIMKTMAHIFNPFVDIQRLKLLDANDQTAAAVQFLEWFHDPLHNQSLEYWLREGKSKQLLLDATANKQRAFVGHDDPEHMRLAADYADQWVRGDNGTLSTFYICRAGSPPCHTLILSQCWETLKADPAASGQRWYCNECGARCQTKRGMIVDIVHDNIAHYCYTDLPPPAPLGCQRHNCGKGSSQTSPPLRHHS